MNTDILGLDTVAAISTPYGRGGIAVIRISGERAFDIADKVFKVAGGVLPSSIDANLMKYGHICYNNELIDSGMIVRFAAPHSYTGEDAVEISCHGGVLVSKKVLQAVFEAGALPAGPGEFTKRAFMNGKLSLSQAEAVIGIIDAESTKALRLALSHASGTLTKKINALYDELADLLARSYVYSDYPDEDLSDLTVDEMKRGLNRVLEELEALYATYENARSVNEGIYTVITGKPNTGKSSLFNLLLGKNRAIVSDIEGTTRDFIEDNVSINGVLLKLCDTAGIRKSQDRLENAGIERSLELLDRAELVIAVFDSSCAADERDIAIIEQISKKKRCRKIALLNKSDLGDAFSADLSSFDFVIKTDAVTPFGINELERAVLSMFDAGDIDFSEQATIANARQAASIRASCNALIHGIRTLEDGYTQDIAGLDIEEALARLGESDGRQVSEDIVDRIFHNFCVGK